MNLDAAILTVLSDDTESTELILDAIRQIESEISEALLLEALRDLELGGLIRRTEQRFAGPETAGTGVPELDMGRSAVTWWGLTAAGRVRLRALDPPA